jgi:hypothetical protein
VYRPRKITLDDDYDYYTFYLKIMLCFAYKFFFALRVQGRIQEIQKEGAGTVSSKTLILACGKSIKYSGSMHAYSLPNYPMEEKLI